MKYNLQQCFVSEIRNHFFPQFSFSYLQGRKKNKDMVLKLYGYYTHYLLRTHDGEQEFRIKLSDLCLLSNQSKALNRSNNLDCSLRAHLFMSYHLIKVRRHGPKIAFFAGVSALLLARTELFRRAGLPNLPFTGTSFVFRIALYVFHLTFIFQLIAGLHSFNCCNGYMVNNNNVLIYSCYCYS